MISSALLLSLMLGAAALSLGGRTCVDAAGAAISCSKRE
jgi:hypothetical protein